jgi:aromatic ring-opening dioxygenase LigB subunit
LFEQNLKNIDPDLYRVLNVYNINQQYLAEKIFEEEWQNAQDDATKKKLIGRLRNKVLGFGNLLPREYLKLQQVVLSIGEDITNTVADSISRTHLERKEKIKRILEGYDDATLEELLNHH